MIRGIKVSCRVGAWSTASQHSFASSCSVTLFWRLAPQNATLRNGVAYYFGRGLLSYLTATTSSNAVEVCLLLAARRGSSKSGGRIDAGENAQEKTLTSMGTDVQQLQQLSQLGKVTKLKDRSGAALGSFRSFFFNCTSQFGHGLLRSGGILLPQGINLKYSIPSDLLHPSDYNGALWNIGQNSSQFDTDDRLKNELVCLMN